MLQAFSVLIGIRAHIFRLSGFVAIPLFALLLNVGSLSASQGQQLPSGILQELNRSQSSSSQATLPPQPQSVILQPAVPPQARGMLPQSRVEQILSQRAGAVLQQFGYDQLGRGGQVIVPETGAVQDDYILGPGDEVVVSLRGQENSEFRANVDRNGQVMLPRLAPIAATGRSFGSFREDVQAAVHRAYVATEASVAVARMRQISVVVSGEVNNPGPRLVTGLSSAVDALMLSGGIKKTGSLRAVRVVRGGRSYTLDLYSVLTGSGSGAAMRLADGDRILVPSLGKTVAVTGLVRHPGIFELAPGQSSMSVSKLLSLAGGQEVRGRYRLSVLQITPQGDSSMVALSGQAGQVRDSEILFVQLSADQTTSQATLSGGSGLAGTYPVVSGTRLSDVLQAPGALGASPYTPFGIIVRRDPATLMQSLVAFTPSAVLAGRENQSLLSSDIIRILSTNEIQLLNFVVQTYVEGLATQQTAIRNPLGQKDSASNSLANVVSSQTGQGQELDGIGNVPASIQRQQVLRLLDRAAPGSLLAKKQDRDARIAANRAAAAAQRQKSRQVGAQDRDNPSDNFDPDAAVNDPSADQGGDPSSGQYTDSQMERDDGSSSRQYSSSGQFNDRTQSNPAHNFNEQVVDNERFALNREVQTFGQLARQLGVDPLVLINFLAENRVKLDGAVRGPGYYFVGANTSLNELVQAAGGTVSWADESGVELISTAIDRQSGHSMTQRTSLPLRQGMLASYIVRPGDQIRFNQAFTDIGAGSVTVQGQVRFAGTFPIIRGEHLSSLLTRAGGLTNVAYPYGTVFLRRSAAQIEREAYTRAANEVQNQLVVAMTRVGNDKIEPATFASMQTFVTELRNQQALGRISITADPSVLASNPAQDPLLEPGDVVYIPQRPSTIAVMGQVLQPGSYPYKAGESLGDYVQRAGGYSSTADESQTLIVLPDGSARRVERSWLSFSENSLPPGSAIVVPRDVTPLDLRQTIIDVSQVLSQFAVSIASVAVLSKQ
jgi:polysaccharide export outer membrane protein